jgi:hypothetical protein
MQAESQKHAASPAATRSCEQMHSQLRAQAATRRCELVHSQMRVAQILAKTHPFQTFLKGMVF